MAGALPGSVLSYGYNLVVFYFFFRYAKISLWVFKKFFSNLSRRRKICLPALKEIQKENKYVGKKECEDAARYFSLPLARVFSAASFFDFS